MEFGFGKLGFEKWKQRRIESFAREKLSAVIGIQFRSAVRQDCCDFYCEGSLKGRTKRFSNSDFYTGTQFRFICDASFGWSFFVASAVLRSGSSELGHCCGELDESTLIPGYTTLGSACHRSGSFNAIRVSLCAQQPEANERFPH